MLYPNHQILQELLIAKDWKKADLETKRLTFEINPTDFKIDPRLARVELFAKVDAFSTDEILNIDRLWVEHSNARFGYSIQYQIYKDIEKTYKDIINEAWYCIDDYWLDGDWGGIVDPAKQDDSDLYIALKNYPYPVKGLWSVGSALAIEIGWLSPNSEEFFFDLETIYSGDSPKGHLPTTGKQGLGCAFHHGYLIGSIFSKLFPK